MTNSQNEKCNFPHKVKNTLWRDGIYTKYEIQTSLNFFSELINKTINCGGSITTYLELKRKLFHLKPKK